MTANPASQKTSGSALLSHHHFEVDGVPVRECDMPAAATPGALVRIRGHLYIDGFALTAKAPSWLKMFGQEFTTPVQAAAEHVAEMLDSFLDPTSEVPQ